MEGGGDGITMRDEYLESQSDAYEWVPGFKAGPMSGPGRWARFPDGTVLYTDDADVIFAKNDVADESPITLLQLVLAIRKLFERGETATAAFNLLKADGRVSSGDLATIA